MTKDEVINLASQHLLQLPGHIFDILSVSKPSSAEAAVNLTKIVSKLSPIVGNLIEFNIVEFLNSYDEFKAFGEWRRQDPGFPDTIFHSEIKPTPGFEIKAWFPLATEITARFKDSQNHFSEDQTYVAILAWLPEYLIFGKPKIIDIAIVSGLSVAKARDKHYHNPPDYLVLEPEDTTERTANLQQSNTNGYKFQGTTSEFKKAETQVSSWGEHAKDYLPTPEYQLTIRILIENYRYRLDTNFAKMDRIAHEDIEKFKVKVYSTLYLGKTVFEWKKLLFKGDELDIVTALTEYLEIK